MRFRLPNPATALFGPIFQKEVRAAGRRRGTYILRFVYTLGLLALIGIAFWGARTSGMQRSAVQHMQDLQQLAPSMTMVAMWFQFLALALIAPMLASPVICDERRARSLSTLLTTPLGAGEIILGKMTSRLVQIVILALISAPVLLAIRVFGGLEPGIVLAYTGVSLSIAVLGASLGVLYSIWHRRATSAALFALLSLVLVQGAPTAIEAILFYVINDDYYGRVTYPFHEQVAATAAPYALLGLSQTLITGSEIPTVSVHSPLLYRLLDGLGLGGGANPVGLVTVGPVWVVNSLYNLLMSGVITGISVVALRRVMRKDGGESNRIAPRRGRRRRAEVPAEGAALESAVEPQEEPPKVGLAERENRTVSDRPILWRELRRAGISSRLLRRAVIGVSLGGLLLLYLRVGLHEYGLHMTIAVLGALIVMVQGIFMTTGGIASEREGRTWEVLLTTPVTGSEVVVGKFLGSLRAQWFLPTLAVLHFVIAVLAGAIPPVFVGQYVLILAGPVLLLTATGQYVSLAFRKGIVGAVVNLCIGLGLWIGLWIVLGLVGWFGDVIDTDRWEDFQKVPYALNPAFMAGSACDAVADLPRFRPELTDYEMTDIRVGFGQFMAWLIGAFAFYVLSAGAVLAITIASFRGLSGRSS